MSTVGIVFGRVRLEQRSFWRNPQSAFFTFLLPVALLVLLGAVNHGRDASGERTITLEVPGILAFGLIAATYANLAVTVSAQRDEGILKRLRATPLPAWVFVAGQIGSALLTALLLTLVFVVMGRVLFGVALPAAHAPAFAVTVLVGSACFCSLGLALTVGVRNAAAASPIANATYVPLTLVSGVFFPSDVGPPWLRGLVSAFPVRPLSAAMQATFRPHSPGLAFSGVALAVLAAWALVGTLISVRWFRWTR